MDSTSEPAALVRSLSETAARIEAASRPLSPEQLIAPPPQGGWSPNEILWHIRAQADVYGEHITRILNKDEQRWRHVSPRARMKKARYDLLPFAESFADFAQQRSELVALLGNLQPGSWERVAVVRVEQREWRLTLVERVRGIAKHEEIHCAQLEQVSAALSHTAGNIGRV